MTSPIRDPRDDQDPMIDATTEASEEPQRRAIIIHPDIQGGSEEERSLIAAQLGGPTIRPSLPGPIVTARLLDTPPTTTAALTASSGGAEAPVAATTAEPRRASSLDALRGVFLISILFAFTLPSEGLPLWMYHRQFPPPGDKLVEAAGLGWRDLAYAAFLFTMASALPLALSRRIEKGATEIEIVGAMLRRYALLVVFALMIGHSNTFFLGYTQTARLLSLAGFGLMAMILTRRRSDWSEDRFRLVRRIGWVLVVAYLALTPLTYGKTFSFERYDPIIAGLAFASLAGALIWYFTRGNFAPRFVILALTVALYLGAKTDGWIQHLWYATPLTIAFRPSRLTLLIVAIPGTIAGDIILRWMRASRETADQTSAWSGTRMAALAVACAAITPIMVAGLYARQVALTTQVILSLVAAGVALTWKPRTAADQMVRALFLWGSLWLTLGLFLEPFEGGIKKVPDTLSYYFTVTGTTSLLLVSLTVVVEGLKRGRWVKTLVDVGQNPLFAYVVYSVFINSLLEMIPPLRGVLRASPGEAILRSILITSGVILLVQAMTRRRIYWRT